MQVTYSEILTANIALAKLFQAVQNPGEKPMPWVPPIAALRLARATKILSLESEIFEAGRITLVKEYSPKLDEKGNPIIPPDSVGDFNNRLRELMSKEVDLKIDLIPLSSFRDQEMPWTFFIGLEWLIEE